ncbi:MAG: hypothetical protein Q7N50_00260 [Armatimonadota bacterium]|nr:hypothetical protein [Armatimonadota bacterium]
MKKYPTISKVCARLIISISLIVAILFVFVTIFNKYVPQPPSLIVLPGATDVDHVRYKGNYQLSYKLQERYPAKHALREISARLAKQGWKPLKEDFLNPGLPTSHIRGWTEFYDATRTPEERVRAWASDWKNAKGDVVRYAFYYHSPTNQPENLSVAQVFANYSPAALAKKQRRLAIRAMERLKNSAQ